MRWFGKPIPILSLTILPYLQSIRTSRLGSTYYGRAANSTSNETSILLSAIATPGYLRQEENQYLAVPWEGVADKYPTAVQRFLGYYVSRPYGGAVEHMEPLDYLKVKGDWSRYIPVDLI
jgi:ectoine hydroxylase-related dioxygenase (phytanoyl-CoA dioxygenase family)